jgi:putative transposase
LRGSLRAFCGGGCSFRESAGEKGIYQGRFKAFPVASDEHMDTVLRYVERNPRAHPVSRAEDWRWSSRWRRQRARAAPLLHAWPLPVPADWLALVNEPQTAGEVEAVRRSVQRSCPYGAAGWREETARQLGLEASLRPPGRPRKAARSTGMLF